MNKRQFEETENRIREAAENVSPSFSEESWEAMALLLDKEFPEKRRKRFFFFWFWPLVGAALAGMVLSSGLYNNDKQVSVFKSTNNTNLMAEDKSGESRIKNRNKDNQLNRTLTVIDNNNHSIIKARGFVNEASTNLNGVSISDQEAIVVENGDDNNVKVDLPATLKTDSTQKVAAVVPSADSVSQDNKSIKKEYKGRKVSGLYFIAAGSFVNNSAGDFPSGRVSEEYGIGVGYRINPRLSVQTGIYAGKKKYNANKNEYYFLPGSYYRTVDVNNIKADCYVIDIPVAVRYDIVQKRKYTLYAMAAISSYIMKSETYIYSYTKNGTAHVSERTYSGNSHLLSVAGISAGYERKLNQRISIMAEPYIKLPLSGVGEGKVKLHSTGLLLGIKYYLPNKMK